MVVPLALAYDTTSNELKNKRKKLKRLPFTWAAFFIDKFAN